MGYPETTVSPHARISTTNTPDGLDIEYNPKTVDDTEKAQKVAEWQAPEEQLDVGSTEPKTKKSLSFKLAFIGLAASLFVFQVDATCLGIALPVSHNSCATYVLDELTNAITDYIW